MGGSLFSKPTRNANLFLYLGAIAYNRRIMCEPKRRKKWDDVTVTAWIPARICTSLDVFARRLNMDRRQALEIVLCSILPEKDFLADLEKLLRREL